MLSKYIILQKHIKHWWGKLINSWYLNQVQHILDLKTYLTTRNLGFRDEIIATILYRHNFSDDKTIRRIIMRRFQLYYISKYFLFILIYILMQEKSEKTKSSRSKLSFNHYAGTKSFLSYREEKVWCYTLLIVILIRLLTNFE